MGIRRLTKIGVGVAFLAALAAFAVLASTVDHFPGEVAASSWVQSWHTSWLDTAMKLVSAAGAVVVAVTLVLSAALVLFLKGLRHQAVLIVGSTLVGYGLRTALKAAIGRPRPTADVVQVFEQADGYSFPSGHVMHYVVFLGVLILIVSAGTRYGLRHWLIRGAVVAVLILIGLSRIYLGVHWLGDVMAGYAFGAVVVAGSVWTWRRWSTHSGRDSSSDGAR